VKTREDRPGYEYSEIQTDHFLWRVGLSSFEVVHGLSRVVGLIPEKVVINRRVFEGYQGPDPDSGWLVQLVADLLHRYRVIQQQAPAIPERRGAFSRLVNIGNGELGEGNEVNVDDGLDLSGTLDALFNDLTDVKQLTEVNSVQLYWDAAQAVVEFSDKIREACLIYLDLIHPFLVWSRRVILEEGYLISKAASVERLLVERRNALYTRFVNHRNIEYRED